MKILTTMTSLHLARMVTRRIRALRLVAAVRARVGVGRMMIMNARPSPHPRLLSVLLVSAARLSVDGHLSKHLYLHR